MNSLFCYVGISLFYFHFWKMALLDIGFLVVSFLVRILNMSSHCLMSSIVSWRIQAVTFTEIPCKWCVVFFLAAFKVYLLVFQQLYYDMFVYVSICIDPTWICWGTWMCRSMLLYLGSFHPLFFGICFPSSFLSFSSGTPIT